MPKEGGKGKKGAKKDAMSTAPDDLFPWGVGVNDIIQTPLGAQATVVGVSKGDLWLEFPGKIRSPLPTKAKTKEDMEAYGYVRRPDSAHIERSIMVRQSAIFEQRFYRGPGPKTAAMRLPWPQGLTTGMPLLEMAASMPAAGGDGAGKKPAKKK